MLRQFLLFLAILLTDAYQPKFKVYEIRKARDHNQHIDDHYFDPDLQRIQSVIHRGKDNRKLVRLADDIVKQLRDISARKDRYSDSSGENTDFVDETRSLLVIPSDELVYHTRSDKENILQKLIQTALRTGRDDVEDRTAPPRHRIRYEYDD